MIIYCRKIDVSLSLLFSCNEGVDECSHIYKLYSAVTAGQEIVQKRGEVLDGPCLIILGKMADNIQFACRAVDLERYTGTGNVVMELEVITSLFQSCRQCEGTAHCTALFKVGAGDTYSVAGSHAPACRIVERKHQIDIGVGGHDVDILRLDIDVLSEHEQTAGCFEAVG